MFVSPATAMQESVWWIHQRARNKSLYNLTWRLLCDRPLDTERLRAAWQRLTDRHEALRTAVQRTGDDVTLTVHDTRQARLDVVEVPHGDEELARFIAEEVQEQPIDLADAPLARLTHVRVGERHELLLTVHHIVLDGWAIQLLMAELSTAYEGGEFDSDAVPFTVYAVEQHEARASGKWDKTLDHWRSALDGATATTVAADRPGRFGVGAPGVVIRHMLSAEASAGVAALAKASFATPFAIMLAALEIVLARTAGNDISLGVVAANRMSARDQALMGYTANLCVVRASIEDTDTIAAVATRARDGLWQMFAHQHVPYPAVFAALPPATQASLTDAAPLLVSYLGSIGFDLKLGDVGLTWLASPNRAARADMAMSFAEVDGGHRAELEYNTGRYDRDTVVGLLDDVDAVLRADPALTVGALPVRTRAVAGRAETEAVEHQALPSGTEWEVIAQEWAALVESPPTGPDADFFASGGHSLHVVRLLAAVRDRLGAPVDIADWLVEPTPRRLVTQLLNTEEQAAPSTLVTLRDGPGTHLHLVHGAGGGVQDYRELAAALPDDWRVTVSQEVEPLATVPMMARAYRTDLDLAGLTPDVLAGWSMGGQVVFEMAARYPEPPLLALIDSTPPIGQNYPEDVEREWFQDFGRNVMASFGVEGEFGDTLVMAARLAQAGHHVPAHVLSERWDAFLRHARASAGYTARKPQQTRAVVVAADLLDSQLDQWATLTDAAKHRIDADHYGVLRGEAARELALVLVDAAVQ
ncbi:condensation domain-containing protein [Nocardia sp. NRRL S-836]|uniref:condensation domain-containing protein n=1 Tax=Nocardia sp. NRRL S-836 TaxID=1519492 RepID=UPI000ACA0C1F|nr:condensation domain-containing protein [Nocardia sp. NRRL S-836]